MRIGWFACFALAPAALAADVRVRTVENRTVEAASFAVEGARIVLRLPGGGTQAVAAEDVVEIAAAGLPPRTPPPPLEFRAVFTNGDSVVGALEGGKPETLMIVSAALGRLEIPFDQLDALLSVRHAASLPRVRPTTETDDVLVRAAGDRLAGLIGAVEPKAVTVKVDTKAVVIPLAEVGGVYFTRLAEPPPPPRELVAVVTLRDGSTVTGVLARGGGDAWTVRSAIPSADGAGARTFTFPAGEFASLYVRNGRCVYVSDLPAPAGVEITEYDHLVKIDDPNDPLSAPFTWTRDRTVDPERPGPLSIRRRVYRKGIGVHARGILRWELGGAYRRFQAAVGIDDSADRPESPVGASAVFQVWVDGKAVWESGNLRRTDPAKEVDVSVEGGRELKLVVECGEDYHILDHADWAEARLIR